jgi:cyclopropane fatty-acyl-phospholipid synthase-like methyltransferase
MEQTIRLEEEVFCLNYELNSMSQLLFKGEAERWVHGYNNFEMENQHVSRYNLAKQYVRDKKVLDIAGGSGYGSYLLAKEGNAQIVDSVDIDKDAVRYGNHRYKSENLTRHISNAETFDLGQKYDVIVSFETIEHLTNYNDFIQNISNQLNSNGMLIVSTPINSVTTKNCVNPYHVIEWSFTDFQDLISKNFDVKEIYVQSIVLKNDLKMRRIKSLYRKILNHKRIIRPFIEKFDNQYDSNDIYSGLQVLICSKK